MFSYLESLPPNEREIEIARIEKELQAGTFDPVPYYRAYAMQGVARGYSNEMIFSVTLGIGGVILGSALFGFGTALAVGGLCLAQKFLNSWKKQAGAFELLENEGDFTQYLDKPALREYQKINEVMVQQAGKALPFTEQAQILPVAGDYQQPAKIGGNTRLNAIDVPSIPVTPLEEAQFSVEPSQAFYNPAKDMGENPQSSLIVGTPGAGKGVLVSNAIRHLKAKHPNLKIFGIDPKNDPKESGYWSQGFDIVKRRSFDSADFEKAIYWLMNCIEEFKRLPGEKLLVIDELTLIGQYFDLMDSKNPLKMFKAFIVHISSTGDSYNHHVWLIGQIANAEDLKFSGGFRSMLRAIALISPKNQAAMNGLLGTKFVSIPREGKPAIERLIEDSPVNRAFFDGKTDRWYPMPELPNHSGYNRDSRSYLGSQPEPRSATPEPLNPSLSGAFSNPEPRSVQRSNLPEPAFTGSEPERSRGSEPEARSLNPAADKAFSGSEPSEPGSSPEPTFMPSQFTRQQALELIQFLKSSGQSQQQIIEGLWRVKKGGSEGWRLAREEYRELTGE